MAERLPDTGTITHYTRLRSDGHFLKGVFDPVPIRAGDDISIGFDADNGIGFIAVTPPQPQPRLLARLWRLVRQLTVDYERATVSLGLSCGHIVEFTVASNPVKPIEPLGVKLGDKMDCPLCESQPCLN